MNALPAETMEEENKHEPAQKERDHERGNRAERVHVVGARELGSTTQRVAEPAPLDERSRHAERDERKERDRDQVAARRHADASDPERKEGEAGNRECGRQVLPRRHECKATRADVRGGPDQRSHGRNERPRERMRKRDEPDAGQRRPNAERE